MARVVAKGKTAAYILLHGGWRVFVSFIAVVAPFYGWVLFYYLSTGAWQQSVQVIMNGAPLLATFFIPLLVGAWVIGFRGWYILVGALSAAVIAGWVSPASLVNQLLPYGYSNLGIVLVLLMIGWRSYYYWRDSSVHKLPVVQYTDGARITIALSAICLVILLLPIRT